MTEQSTQQEAGRERGRPRGRQGCKERGFTRATSDHCWHEHEATAIRYCCWCRYSTSTTSPATRSSPE